MYAIYDNPAIAQIRETHVSAMTLKEQFDKKRNAEVLEGYRQSFEKDLDGIIELIPIKVMDRTELLRHAYFIKLNLRKNRVEDCYSDIVNICFSDLFDLMERYLDYLSKKSNTKERIYDWEIIHSLIKKIAKPRFDNKQYADAVEASFKEINEIVKEKYHTKTGKYEDGDSLMRKAFTSSPNNSYKPKLKLANNSSESGKNIQQGYMDIFAGSMRGIRNPIAHANLNVEPDEAWEMIVLASHLMRMWDKYNKYNS